LNIDLLISALDASPEVKLIITTLKPYLPMLMREGQEFYDDFISFVVDGKWTELDAVAWEKMTEDERDELSDTILIEARAAVDKQFKREKLAKEISFKVAIALLTFII